MSKTKENGKFDLVGGGGGGLCVCVWLKCDLQTFQPDFIMPFKVCEPYAHVSSNQYAREIA